MHERESPPFYRLFESPVLFLLAPKGLRLSSKSATSLRLSCVVIHSGSTTSTSKSLSLLYDTCIYQWLTKEKEYEAFFILDLLSGLRHFVGATLTYVEPGERIAQMFSMCPHNRSDLLHKRTIKT